MSRKAQQGILELDFEQQLFSLLTVGWLNLEKLSLYGFSKIPHRELNFAENRIGMPRNIEVFMEMNNGRVLTLYGFGQFDHAIRTGLAKVLKDQK